MGTDVTAADATRLRLLEGVLRRLARRAAGDLVLRGGLLIRHWVRPVPRPVDDLDLVATAPLDVDAVGNLFATVLADGADDGVAFDPDGVQCSGIFLDTGTPGARVYASGTADGSEDDFHVDVTFGPPPRPVPVPTAIPVSGGGAVRVWACRPEAVVGQKVQALCHLGELGWRPKDLNDLRLLLARAPLDAADLRTAVSAYLADLGRTEADGRAAFGPGSWWGTKFAAARWLDFVGQSRGQAVPKDLAGVAAGVAGRLAPALEGTP